jgi:hypothetical protein
MDARAKGRTTIRISALFFLASVVLELLDVASPVPLFGALRYGAPALLVHVIYAVLYAAIGIGLWRARAWGYRAVMLGTLLITLDKAQLVLARETLYAYVMSQLTVTRDIVAQIPREAFLNYVSAVYVLIVLGWWGFAGYIHLRRAYFDFGG